MEATSRFHPPLQKIPKSTPTMPSECHARCVSSASERIVIASFRMNAMKQGDLSYQRTTGRSLFSIPIRTIQESVMSFSIVLVCISVDR